jgi:arylsulfatase A-like enzyme
MTRIRNLALIIILILASLPSSSCRRPASDVPAPTSDVRRPTSDVLRPPSDPDRPWVFFIVIDALRADALGTYGATDNATPNLDRLGREGVVFKHAYTAAPFTMTSVASIFTGLWPWQHKVMFSEDAGLTLSPELPNLAAAFHDAGYHTVAFSGTYFSLAANGFNHGFDRFDESCAPAFFKDSAECLTQRITAWLASPEAVSGPNFVYIHYVDTHRPYAPPEEFKKRFTAGLTPPPDQDTASGEIDQFGANRKWYQFYRKPSAADLKYLRALYQGEAAYVDDQFGKLQAAIAASPAAKSSAPFILVTADHGEAFYEHQIMEHVADLHDPVMSVPLILSGATPRGRVLDDQVRTIDLMPTLLTLAGIEPPPDISGRSLAPLLRGDQVEGHRFSTGVLNPAAAIHFPHGEPEYTFVLYPWKLFFRPKSGARELFRLDDDPGELHDLAAAEPARVDDMQKQLQAIIKLPPPASASPATPMDPETIKKLKALQYIHP